MKREIGGLDLVRFAAAMIVSAFHLGFWVWAFPTGVSGRAAGPIEPLHALEFFGAFGWVGVEVFFIISGFVIAFSASTATPADFARRRLLRLVPAVWLLAPATAIVALAVDGLWFREAMERLVRSVLFEPFGPWVDSVYWTLGIEVAFYGLIWLLLLLRRQHWLEALAYVLGGLSVVFWLAMLVRPTEALITSRWLDLALIHHGALFAIGMLLWVSWQKGTTVNRSLGIAVFSCGAAIQIAYRAVIEAAKTESAPVAWLPIVIAAVAFGAIVLALKFPFGGRRTRMIGLMTYPLYLIHNVAGAALLGILIRRNVDPYIAVLMVLAVAIVLSWIVSAYAEPQVRRVLDWLIKAGFRPFAKAA